MTKDPLKATGLRIKKCREDLGISQENLAGDIKVSVQTISSAERGLRQLNQKHLYEVAQQLGVTVDYLITGQKVDKDYALFIDRVRSLTDEHQEFLETVLSGLEKLERNSQS